MAGRMWRDVGAWLNRRPAVLPLLVLGAILIAVAAGPNPAESSWTGLPDTAVVQWILAIIVLILALLGLAILMTTRTVGPRSESKRRSWVAMLSAMLLIGLFSLIDFEAELTEVEEAAVPPLASEPIGPQVEPGPGYEPSDLTALVIILAVAVVLLVWTRRSLGDEETVEPDEEESQSIEVAMARARDHLLDGDDPRRAVLLAYRNLERTLESLDLPRRQTETPTEHLARALRHLSITDPGQARPLLDLADLYSRARYSEQRITPDEQQRAAESLDRARERLIGAD